MPVLKSEFLHLHLPLKSDATEWNLFSLDPHPQDRSRRNHWIHHRHYHGTLFDKFVDPTASNCAKSLSSDTRMQDRFDRRMQRSVLEIIPHDWVPKPGMPWHMEWNSFRVGDGKKGHLLLHCHGWEVKKWNWEMQEVPESIEHNGEFECKRALLKA